jgi:leucyl/phenylalanyl-tRNA--protein transferase
MVGLGAETVARERYLDALDETLQKPSDLGSWQHFRWSYPYKEEAW